MPGDYHTHTTFSDGTGSVVDCVGRAAALGLPEVGISDHFAPLPTSCPSLDAERLPAYFAAVHDAARLHPSIKVLAGIEVDYVPGHEDEARRLVASWPFDYVIGAVHDVDGFEFWDPALRSDARWLTSDELFRSYYRLVRRAAESGCFDVIAHMDWIGLWGHEAGPAVEPELEEALDAIAASGVALELNTDRVNDPAGVMYPSLDLLRRAWVRRIPLVISSDAHEPAEVGRLWGEAVGLARRAGYRETLRLSDRALVPLPEDGTFIGAPE